MMMIMSGVLGACIAVLALSITVRLYYLPQSNRPDLDRVLVRVFVAALSIAAVASGAVLGGLLFIAMRG